MARTKSQPIQRQTSSEYTAGQSARTPLKAQDAGLAQQQPNGAAAAAAALAPAKPEAGLPQLVVAVAGIYASLCVHAI